MRARGRAGQNECPTPKAVFGEGGRIFPPHLLFSLGISTDNLFFLLPLLLWSACFASDEKKTE